MKFYQSNHLILENRVFYKIWWKCCSLLEYDISDKESWWKHHVVKFHDPLLDKIIKLSVACQWPSKDWFHFSLEAKSDIAVWEQSAS